MISRFSGANGLDLVADVDGDPANPPVLLLPGFGQTRQAWKRVAKALVAAGRYVVAVDLRGHGESAWSHDRHYRLDDIVEDVAAIIRQMPPNPAVVGASLGGVAALAAIGEALWPIASALVLADAAPQMAREGLDRMAALLTLDKAGFITAEEAADAIAHHLPGRARPSTEDLKRHLRRADDGRFRWHMDPAYQEFQFDDTGRLAAQERFKAAANALKIPTLLVRGTASEMIDQRSIDLFRELVPHAECVDIEGAGDTIVGDRYDAFDTVILEFLERVVPRPGAAPQGGVSPQTLRDAMGCFATGVTVITTSGPTGEPLGFTANSFTSVSLDPPLVLFCIKRESANMAALQARNAFAVNVLHIGQQSVSSRFASKDADRFAGVDWERWEHDVPIILEALANFECSIHEVFEGGDHFVVIGQVRRVRFDPTRDPLLFLQGKYRRIHVPQV